MPEYKEIPRQATLSFAPGETPESTEYSPGDFILVHHPDKIVSKLIRLGQTIRIHGEDRKYCYWNHAAMITSYSGDLMEALGSGITATHLSDYNEKHYVLVKVAADFTDREQMMDYCDYVLGEKYGFLTIASIAFCTLTGGKFVFSMENQLICSGFVARCQERAGALFSRNPAHVMPADLAKYYDVQVPRT